MDNQRFMRVEVVYLSSIEQIIVPLKVAENTSALEAIHLSKLLEKFPDINLNHNKVGIFGKIISLDVLLQDGARVEIYRPLLIDPKEIRLLKVKKRINLRKS